MNQDQSSKFNTLLLACFKKTVDDIDLKDQRKEKLTDFEIGFKKTACMKLDFLARNLPSVENLQVQILDMEHFHDYVKELLSLRISEII